METWKRNNSAPVPIICTNKLIYYCWLMRWVLELACIWGFCKWVIIQESWLVFGISTTNILCCWCCCCCGQGRIYQEIGSGAVWLAEAHRPPSVPRGRGQRPKDPTYATYLSNNPSHDQKKRFLVDRGLCTVATTMAITEIYWFKPQNYNKIIWTYL